MFFETTKSGQGYCTLMNSDTDFSMTDGIGCTEDNGKNMHNATL